MPAATLRFDGAVAIQSEAAPPLPAPTTETLLIRVALGPYQYSTSFGPDCTIWYDDIWIAPTPE